MLLARTIHAASSEQQKLPGKPFPHAVVFDNAHVKSSRRRRLMAMRLSEDACPARQNAATIRVWCFGSMLECGNMNSDIVLNPKCRSSLCCWLNFAAPPANRMLEWRI